MRPLRLRRVGFARRRQLLHLRRDLGAGADALQARDDDRLVAVQPLADQAVAVDARPRPHHVRGDRAVVGDDPDDAPVLVGRHGFVGNEDAAKRRGTGNADRAEQAGREEEVRVRRHGAAPDRAGRLVDAVVDEIEAPLAGRLFFVSDADKNLVAALPARWPAAGLGGARVGQIGSLVHVEVEIDRIERDDRGQKRRIGGDEIARRDQVAAGASGDGGADFGEAEVQARGPDRGLSALEVGPRRLERLPALLQHLFGDVARAAERLRPFEVALGVGHARLRRDGGRLGLIHGGLVGPLVDHVEQIALLDDRAILERHLVEIARHPRPHLDRLDSLEPARVVVLLHDILHNRLGDGHGRWLALARRLGEGGSRLGQRQSNCEPKC